jgi:Cu2+-exporting ATPase
VIGIPLAAGCYVALFGWTLNPMFGAAAMGLSSFCVVSNALRLNLLRVYDGSKDKTIRNPIEGRLIQAEDSEMENIVTTNDIKETEDKIMKIKVNGMMCGHCEAHVKKALEAIDGVETVVASHDENLVTITLSKDIDEAVIKAAVTEAGYEYAGII